MKRAAVLVGLGTTLLGAPARGQTQDDWDGDFGGKTAERRSDVMFAGGLGGIVGAASGYPNEAGKIDDPDFEASTGAGAGYAYQLRLGGALADWLNVGLGYGAWNFRGSGPKAEGMQVILRVETFPAFSVSELGRNLGVFTDLGLGTGTIVSRGKDVAEAGATSIIGIGAFYEPWTFGRWSAGPEVEWVHAWSGTMASHTGVIGLRLVYYGGPKAKDPTPPPATEPAAPWPAPGAPPAPAAGAD